MWTVFEILGPPQAHFEVHAKMLGTKEASQRWIRHLFDSRSIRSSHHQEILNFKQDHRATVPHRPSIDNEEITDQDKIRRTSQQDHRGATRHDSEDIIAVLSEERWARNTRHGGGRRNFPFRRSHSRLCYRIQTIWHLYPSLTKDKKGSVWKRAGTLITDNGEIYVQRKKEEWRLSPLSRSKDGYWELAIQMQLLHILEQQRHGEELHKGSIGEEWPTKWRKWYIF